ncbi:YebC/PmpR family DNA-binding transcriptional regulator [candidate division WS5 bacterium]|uniref:Probable transcriptional regulatory protein C4544_00810 n=1 Tax=candidate division WS5 bacterium TaxID=2093353 RepID=A0A419DG29_9BACT|nr:MAG: YebC/PmpR family DNA-binding transcriptional regulator [candidate division WS5 bacterium]
MSGHSKWASIKHKKAATDAKRGKVFTQAANMIAIAAKEGGGDPTMNFKLRLAIDKAKAVNMPSSNIERAIKRGTGEGGGGRLEELIYEGYGHDGVAILIGTVTDNKNRTSAEVRSTLTKHGGRMADAGAVLWVFDQQGQIIAKDASDETQLSAIDAGARDVEEEDGKLFIYCDIKNIKGIKEALEEIGVAIESAEVTYRPKNYIKIEDEDTAKKILKLIDALESLDDVTDVYANFDIPEEVLEKAS